ncbi:MAG: T9SS type A sorting domain-containing protein [Bacteroidales bacterium]|nr:T9SS type A sorting domain-containing protein [Bacteroidales bacterium]
MRTTARSFFIAFITFIACSAVMAVEVTFRVDMSLQTVPPEGVHIAGSFQGWNPGGTAMILTSNNIYEYTAGFTEGESLEYKYINGDAWGEDESVPPECAQNNNRYLTVPANDTILVAVCFGSCAPCGSPVNITFKVDMSEQTVSPNGVHIAGSFQGWNPGSTEMTDMGNGLYSHTITLSAGEYVEYKYINGNDWTGEEQVPAACGVSNGVGGYNRFYTVPNANTTLNEVCFGSCNPCGYIPVEVDITFRVDMSKEVVSPDGIHLAGSFQGWEPAGTEMTDIGNGIFAVTLPMMSGEYHEYKFINGMIWDSVEMVPPECGHDDGQGGFNRYISVPETDSTLTGFCFSSCDPCNPVGIFSQPGRDELEVNVWPNPFSDEVTIKFYTPGKGEVNLRLFNSLGACIWQHNEWISAAGLQEKTVSAENGNNGIYYLKVVYTGAGEPRSVSARLIKR